MNLEEPRIPANVSHVLDQVQKLPSMPSLVMEIMESLNKENVDVSTLANKVALDHAIVARVLRVANSPFFGMSRQIVTIPEAISVLGLNNLRGMVAAAAIINAFSSSRSRFHWQKFWRHSIGAGACAKVLAKRAGLNAEAAFTAGLLHDIGYLVMCMYFPEAYAQLVQSDSDSTAESLQAEQATLGMDHAALGGEMARRWRFPQPMAEAVRLHHTQAGAGQEKTLADVVFVANLFAHALDGGRVLEDKESRLAIELYNRLGIEDSALVGLAEEAGRLYDSTIRLID